MPVRDFSFFALVVVLFLDEDPLAPQATWAASKHAQRTGVATTLKARNLL